MKITKAVITAAARNQRSLPLQTLFDRDGEQKSVLRIIVEEALRAGIDDICVVTCPGDENEYQTALGDQAGKLRFISQSQPRGYGHAVHCAKEFVGAAPFLHMVGDHIYVSGNETGCAQQLVEAAGRQDCSLSGVQPTRENLLPYFGAVGGQRVKGSPDLYIVDRVIEKPTPTQAEQYLLVPGLRAGHYLCYFGMHVLTPLVMELLDRSLADAPDPANIQLSPVLDELAAQERYLALETQGRRYAVDVRYGLLTAQLALALSGQDRDEVLAGLCELLAQRELNSTKQ